MNDRRKMPGHKVTHVIIDEAMLIPEEVMSEPRKIKNVRPLSISPTRITAHTVDEVIIHEEDRIKNFRSRFVGDYRSSELGYTPPFPITQAEERLQQRNQIPEQQRIQANQVMDMPPYPPLPSDVRRWRRELRMGMASTLTHRNSIVESSDE